MLNVINYQRELPNIPIHDLTIRVRLDGRTPTAVSLLPDHGRSPSGSRTTTWSSPSPGWQDFVMVEIGLLPNEQGA